MKNRPLLSARRVSKSFGGVQALVDASIEIMEGEILGVIGPNGAGKSTLAGVIVGSLRPDRGQIIFRDSDITKYSRRRRAELGIAHTHQIPRVFPSLTVRENMSLACSRGLGGGTEDGLHETAERLGLGGLLSLKASQLSHGQMRLLEIGMALLSSPRLLVMDEPTQGLAGGEVASLSSILRGLAGKLAVVLIDHRVDFVVSLSERVAVMNLGRFVAVGAARGRDVGLAIEEAYLRWA
ncbi:MAG: ATP-binding cassette domain-containing protein [Nitrososphaerota archaeon]|nr:ATP-binding cassette domain-containing protein [Candidatus Calditenuaceae archaeon]MDW8073739.1 ATP-binding cassette domain-containing protein [Nitrososphaerota archaeon]